MTNQKFAALARNADGDIIALADVFFKLTPAQVERLSEDDYSRYDDYQEELRCMMAELG